MVLFTGQLKSWPIKAYLNFSAPPKCENTMAVLTKSTLVEVEMAKPSIAAPCVARNKSVLEITRIFEQSLKYIADDKANCKFKSNCLQSFETLIDLGFKAVKQNNIKSDIDTYQQYFESYIYYSSVYLDNRTQSRRISFNDCVFQLAQSLANMLLLAENNFAKLSYPSYYQDFAKAIEVLFECVGGGG